MSDKRIKCPFCEGVAHVKLNARLDPFISCPRCGPINARGARYREFIEKNQYEAVKAVAPAPDKQPADKIESPEETLYKHTAPEKAVNQEDWLEKW